MRKPDLVAAVADETKLSKADVSKLIDAILTSIQTAVGNQEKVTLVGFGSFQQRHRGARTGKNPQTGEPMKIKASNTVAFTPGKALKSAITSAPSSGKPASAPAKKAKK